MPELPDVEGFRAIVEAAVVGRTIVRARAFDDWMLKDVTRRTLARELAGRPVSGTARRGKILMIMAGSRNGEPDPPALVLHFGMTGHPVVTDASEPPHRWDRLVLELDTGSQFRFRNMRRLGFIRLVTRTGLSDLLWGLGPDALEAPASWLQTVAARRTAPIKAVLLDQGAVAGIGNIYADEALFEARIDPRRPANTLTRAEVRRLHGWIRRTLEAGIAANVAQVLPPLRFAGIRGPSGECPRCGEPLRSATIGGRTTYFCGRCVRHG